MIDNQTVGAGFATRLATYINDQANTYAARADANETWDAPRVDLARRVALVIVILGDSDPRVKLIHGATGDVENCRAALDLILAPTPNIDLERREATRTGARFDGPAFRSSGAPWDDWIAKQSDKRLDADVEGLVLALAAAAHEAEHEDMAGRVDRLEIELHSARKPDPALDELRARVDVLTREGETIRDQLKTARLAEAGAREDVAVAHAALRQAARNGFGNAEPESDTTAKPKRATKAAA